MARKCISKGPRSKVRIITPLFTLWPITRLQINLYLKIKNLKHLETYTNRMDMNCEYFVNYHSTKTCKNHVGHTFVQKIARRKLVKIQHFKNWS